MRKFFGVRKEGVCHFPTQKVKDRDYVISLTCCDEKIKKYIYLFQV